MNQPQNQNKAADGQSRAGEAEANLTDVFATVDDLATIVRRLAHSLRQAAPDNDLPEKALDYLRRKGLQGSPLRKVSNGGANSAALQRSPMEAEGRNES